MFDRSDGVGLAYTVRLVRLVDWDTPVPLTPDALEWLRSLPAATRICEFAKLLEHVHYLEGVIKGESMRQLAGPAPPYPFVTFAGQMPHVSPDTEQIIVGALMDFAGHLIARGLDPHAVMTVLFAHGAARDFPSIPNQPTAVDAFREEVRSLSRTWADFNSPNRSGLSGFTVIP